MKKSLTLCISCQFPRRHRRGYLIKRQPGSALQLEDGSRVAVIGGGPGGSLSAYFLLTFARRMDLDLAVDIYEPQSSHWTSGPS